MTTHLLNSNGMFFQGKKKRSRSSTMLVRGLNFYVLKPTMKENKQYSMSCTLKHAYHIYIYIRFSGHFDCYMLHAIIEVSLFKHIILQFAFYGLSKKPRQQKGKQNKHTAKIEHLNLVLIFHNRCYRIKLKACIFIRLVNWHPTWCTRGNAYKHVPIFRYTKREKAW